MLQVLKICETNDRSFFHTCTAQKTKWQNSEETADLVTFTEKILNGKLHFLCSVETTRFALQFTKRLIVK